VRSLRELEEFWSIEDLLDAEIALDIWEQLEAEAYAAAKAAAER